jgi:hypothetical protein
VSVEGRSVLVAFEPDPHEHRRRDDQEVGAISSRRLLHALWSLPDQLRWPASGLDPYDTETLLSQGAGFVQTDGGNFVRLYQPPGQVRAVGLRSRRLDDAVQRVGLFPPIFFRYAIAARRCRSDDEAVITASAKGIGTAIAGSSGLTVLSEPDPPRTGVPGVYRWWLAEVAYEAWRQVNVH